MERDALLQCRAHGGGLPGGAGIQGGRRGAQGECVRAGRGGGGGSDLVLLPEQQGMGQPQLLHQSGTILCNLTSQVQVQGGGDSSRRAGGEG